MKQGYADITVVLDRSGSMGVVQTDIIGGFNTFLKEQKAIPGEATITLVQFDHEYDVVYEAKPLAEAPELTLQTYQPLGMTALEDALGRAIDTTGRRLARMREEDRPDRVLFVILTDGMENSSKEYGHDQIAEMIRHQTEVYSWQFLYLGANHDAVGTAVQLNIPAQHAMNYMQSSAGICDAYYSVSLAAASYRTAASGCLADSINLTQANEEQLKKMSGNTVTASL